MKRLIPTRVILLLLSAMLGIACAADGEPPSVGTPVTGTGSAPSTGDPTPTTVGATDDTEGGDQTVIGGAPDPVIQAVFAAAESHTGVDRRTMTLLKAQAVTFSDGSLNCPEPGMLYTQALINGFWIQIDVDGVILDYRVGDRGGIRLCESGGTEPLPSQDS